MYFTTFCKVNKLDIGLRQILITVSVLILCLKLKEFIFQAVNQF